MQQVTFDKKNRCSRCGKNLTKSVKVLGNQAYTIHSELHYREDTQTYIELAYRLADQLKAEGLQTEDMDMLRELDPEAYERKVKG